MARINSMGMDSILNDIAREHRATPDTMKKMVVAAGDVFAEETREQIRVMKVWDTGATWWSIKRGTVGKRGDGYRLEVWPAGTRVDDTHPSGERVETVAFVTEYGTKHIAAKPFMSTAAIKAAQKAEDAMLEVWERDNQ